MYSRCIGKLILQFITKLYNQVFFNSIYYTTSGMTYGTTIRDLCLRFNPHALRIDEHRLVQFGVLQGIIRRICKVGTLCLLSVFLKKLKCFLLFLELNVDSTRSTNRKCSAGRIRNKWALYIDSAPGWRRTTKSVAVPVYLTTNWMRKSNPIQTFVYCGSDDLIRCYQVLFLVISLLFERGYVYFSKCVSQAFHRSNLTKPV